jgi:two-component system sensor histidine kinase HydH
MLNGAGEAVALIEIYKEPSDLIGRTQRGYLLMWLATSIGGALIYLALYRVVRKAAGLLIAQQKQIIENETLVAMGEMSSALAHSLRNPLASIRSSAELMQALAPDGLQRNLTDVITQVDRMSQWVRDLLVTSGPSAGSSENVDPMAVVEESLAFFQSQIRSSGVEVELVAANDQPAVLSQRLLLLQVLNSLFSNALEAMPKGGLLTIEVLRHSSEPKLTIAIADTGSGMSESQRKRLFQPFTTTKQGGLGIGLVMVKRIMERFGGQVDIHSAQNEGTQIRLTFALAAQ